MEERTLQYDRFEQGKENGIHQPTRHSHQNVHKAPTQEKEKEIISSRIIQQINSFFSNLYFILVCHMCHTEISKLCAHYCLIGGGTYAPASAESLVTGGSSSAEASSGTVTLMTVP